MTWLPYPCWKTGCSPHQPGWRQVPPCKLLAEGAKADFNNNALYLAWSIKLPADLNYSLRFSLVRRAATTLLVLLVTALGFQEAHRGQARCKGRALCGCAPIHKLPIVEQSVWHPADVGMAPARESHISGHISVLAFVAAHSTT